MQVRFDTCEMKLDATRSPEGYVRARAFVTRTGVFPYQLADGRTIWELRHPEDVFKAASLETLKNLLITIEHPNQMVDVNNAKALSVGNTGESFKVDAPFVETSLSITAKEAIDAIEAGKKELSCGYYCDLIESMGSYDGQEFTHRQVNITYNHLAITDQARLGPELRIALDSAFGVMVKNVARTDSQENTMKVKIDGLEYEAAPEVVRALEKANEAVTKEKSRADTAVAAQATAEGQRDSAKADLETLKKGIPQQVADGVKARVALVDSAKKVLADAEIAKLDSMTDEEIKKSVILTKQPEAKLEGRDSAYITARFDSVIESLDTDPDAIAKAREASANRNDGSNANQQTADSARQRMIDRAAGKKV